MPLIRAIHKSMARLSSNVFDRSKTIHCPSGEMLKAPVNSFCSCVTCVTFRVPKS